MDSGTLDKSRNIVCSVSAFQVACAVQLPYNQASMGQLTRRQIMQKSLGCVRRRWWLLFLIAFLLVPLTAQAESQSLHWERYDVDIAVTTDGDLLVQERQVIAFTSGSFHYGYRTIPLGKTDGIENIEVWEGDRPYTQSSSQSEYTFSVDKEGDELLVYWYFPYTSQSKHNFIFKYTVKGGVKINDEEGDSVFWKAVPPDHSYLIKASRVTVRFPAGVDLGTEHITSFGAPAEWSVEGDTVTFVASQALAPGTELEVGVPFGPNLVTAEQPDWQKREERAEILSLVMGVIGALILVGGLLAVLLLWYTRGRDPEVGLVADYISEPPSDAPPGVAGTLVDERADMQDVIASMIDLARRGYLEMIESRASQGLFGLGSGSEFTLRRTNKGWDDLLPFERTILDKIFGSQQEKALSDLKNKFYTAIPKIKKDLYKQTVANQFFRTDPDTVRGRYTGLGIGILVLTGGLGFLIMSILSDVAGGLICPVIGVGITAVAVIIVGQAMPVKTRKGSEETAKWKAFKRYLKEIDRYTQLEEATDQFDKYLPYAIAFGIERSWINKFAAVSTTPVPIWYYPIGMGRGRARAGTWSAPSSKGGKTPSLDGMSRGMSTGLAGMSAGLTSMLNTASSTLVSRPQSSGGGGGWSGGGFSGGGGGGGGSAGFG
jgi:uncharacterized membrane protein